MNTFAPYVAATSCKQYGPAGPQAFLTYMEDRFPYQTSMGICVCRYSSGGGGLSHHAECRAYDQGIPTKADGQARADLGDPILRLVLPHGLRLGIDHAIYNRRVYAASYPSGKYYTGRHPHYDHIHWGFTRNSARYLTYATLVSVLGRPDGGTPTPIPIPLPIGDEVTTAQFVSRLTPEDIEALCMAKSGGGVWVINPRSNDRVGAANYYKSILSNPTNPDWEGFRQEVEVAALVNSVIK